METQTKIISRKSLKTIQMNLINCPFMISIDTREQHPFAFRGLVSDADSGSKPLVINTEIKTLQTGDYSISGHESRIAIERKSLSDAFQTFTRDRERWERELERMAEIEFAFVVIEGSFDDLSQGPIKQNGWKVGKSVMRSIDAWTFRYPNVHWFPMSTRDQAEAKCFRLLERFWKEVEWQNKELNKLEKSLLEKFA